MKTPLTLSLLAGFLFHLLPAQSLGEFYDQENFAEVVKFADKTAELVPEDIYRIGYAFFILENDKKAIEMYDLAIEKGLEEDYVYLFKGLAQRYDKQMEAAAKSFREAIKRNPTRQKNVCELGNVFYLTERYDSALVYFKQARSLDYELGDPYRKVAYIYHQQGDLEQALKEYKISASLINKEDPVYLELLMSMGQLESGVFQNYDKGKEALTELLTLEPASYEAYEMLIESHYVLGEEKAGDSLFQILKTQYAAGKLPEEMQEMGSIPVGRFTWKDQRVIIYKKLKEPKEMLDEIYRIYLLTPDGKSIERTLMTEQTIQLEENGAKHLLCERHKSGGHSTYSYGWSTDSISVKSLKKSVLMVLNEDIKPSASSNFGAGGSTIKMGAPTEKENKAKEKKKKAKKKKTKKKKDKSSNHE